MMLLLLTRSARIPPKGDSRMVGSMETASMVANMDALPVTCKYIESKEKTQNCVAERENDLSDDHEYKITIESFHKGTSFLYDTKRRYVC